MPVLNVKKKLVCEIEHAWEIITQIADYPKFMPSVLEVEVLEKKLPHQTLSRWQVRLNDSLMEWQERDLYDASQYQIHFYQTEGDLKAFSGAWQLRSIGPSYVEVCLRIEFDIGIPALEEIIHPIALEALQKNANSMLDAIEAKVSAPWRAIA